MDSTTENQTLPSALECFEAVKAGDLDSVGGLVDVVERLCSSLRELRAQAPESFFGQPVERLYDSLEAALACFHRSRVESTSSEVPSDSGAI